MQVIRVICVICGVPYSEFVLIRVTRLPIGSLVATLMRSIKNVVTNYH
jgi:hypothetical protein